MQKIKQFWLDTKWMLIFSRTSLLELSPIWVESIHIEFEYDENNLEIFEKLINKVVVERPQRRYKKVNVNICYKFSKWWWKIKNASFKMWMDVI